MYCKFSWKSVIDSKKEDIDGLFTKFYNKLNKLRDKHPPNKNMSKREIKQSGKPWITKTIKTKEPLKEEIHYFIQLETKTNISYISK